MERKSFKYVIGFDGEKEYDGPEILENDLLKKSLGAANVLYYNFLDEINAAEAYLYIDISNDRPTFQVKDAPLELLEKLKAANLYGN